MSKKKYQCRIEKWKEDVLIAVGDANGLTKNEALTCILLNMDLKTDGIKKIKRSAGNCDINNVYVYEDVFKNKPDFMKKLSWIRHEILKFADRNNI